MSELREFAIIVDPRYDVAVVKNAVSEGTSIDVPGRTIRITSDVRVGDRFALCAIPSGEMVRQYGQPIGT